jgi:biotin transport system substrate-specific component
MQASSSIARPGIHPLVRRYSLVVLFAALVCIGGYLRIPIPGNPVPVTLQITFVMLAGAFLSPAMAAVSMVLFVASGLAGAPVYSGGGAGLAYLLGPTGGYLIGFAAGAALCSFLIGERRDSFSRIVLGMLAGLAMIYCFGVLRLAIYLGGDAGMAFRLGVLPFFTMDLLKVSAAAAVVAGTSSLLPKGSDGAR